MLLPDNSFVAYYLSLTDCGKINTYLNVEKIEFNRSQPVHTKNRVCFFLFKITVKVLKNYQL